jgi:hypothetical protein
MHTKKFCKIFVKFWRSICKLKLYGLVGALSQAVYAVDNHPRAGAYETILSDK